ncbi:hypothetical protein [Fructilactobacillus frigidiflavus]|uniref:hypothetical protein n=1 Tax=Fructilactobacillus frigidiflavus TaxID=3242688 RepID=UPI003757A16C
MKRLWKFFKKIRKTNLLVIAAFLSIISLVCSSSLGMALFAYGNPTNNDKLSFAGSLIGSSVVMFSLVLAGLQLDYQLREERKNSFESAINVENYKQLFDIANQIGAYADELVEIEYQLSYTSVDDLKNKITEFDNRFSKSMSYLNNNFYSILTYYNENKEYKEQFNDLYCKAINNRLNIQNPTSKELQKTKNNLVTFEDDLITLKNYIIFVCTKILK